MANLRLAAAAIVLLAALAQAHVLRDQPVHLCDTVQSYAGYFNVTDKTREYFFWFFESRNDPANDPVVLWLSGGPGCSSMLALFLENGPCSVNADLSLKLNPNSWNSRANVLWIDQPAGTGFSFGKNSDLDHNEAEVARDMYNFLQAFFADHPKFQQNELFVFGESYAGHYVPAVSSAIFNGSANANDIKLNLKGFAIGNGLTAPEVQYQYYPEMAYNNSYKQLVNEREFKIMKDAVGPCVNRIKSCQAGHTASCAEAYEFCNIAEVEPVQKTGVNLYDVRIPCKTPPLCYDMSAIQKFLNLPGTQKALGVNREWDACNMEVNKLFMGDWMQHYNVLIPAMLEGGVRGLIYAGDCDFICNYMGNKAWTLALDWAGHDAFNSAGDQPWTVDGSQAGLVRSAQGFTFLQVYAAGHMVPMDQPARSLEMLNAFIENKPFA